jgi:small multidrug resistance pump
MVWVLLISAIACEVTGAIALKLSDGFSKVVPSVIVFVGYIMSFVLLSQVLKRGMAVGIAYSIWAAIGVALVALIGALFLGEGLTWIQLVGLVLVVAGVAALELGTAH